MNAIFCDIDGVLNSNYHIGKYHTNEYSIEERKVHNLLKIVKATKAEVIIVSHANTFMGEDFNEDRMKQIRKYGVNPIASLESGGFLGSKEDAVNRWLATNKVDKFIIIDDAEDNYYLLVTRLVLVEGKYGLTNRHVKTAIEKMK